MLPIKMTENWRKTQTNFHKRVQIKNIDIKDSYVAYHD